MPRLTSIEAMLPPGFKVYENLPHEGVVVVCDYCAHEDQYGTGPDADGLVEIAKGHRDRCKPRRVGVGL